MLILTKLIYRYNKNGINPLAYYAPGIIHRGELTKSSLEYLRLNGIELSWENTTTTNLVTTEKDVIFKRPARIPKRYTKLIINLFFAEFWSLE